MIKLEVSNRNKERTFPWLCITILVSFLMEACSGKASDNSHEVPGLFMSPLTARLTMQNCVSVFGSFTKILCPRTTWMFLKILLLNIYCELLYLIFYRKIIGDSRCLLWFVDHICEKITLVSELRKKVATWVCFKVDLSKNKFFVKSTGMKSRLLAWYKWHL